MSRRTRKPRRQVDDKAVIARIDKLFPNDDEERAKRLVAQALDPLPRTQRQRVLQRLIATLHGEEGRLMREIAGLQSERDRLAGEIAKLPSEPLERMVRGEGPREPTTPEEWPAAMTLASSIAVMYANGYTTLGGDKVNIERAMDFLKRGEALGYTPDVEKAAQYANQFMNWEDANRGEVHVAILDGQARPR